MLAGGGSDGGPHGARLDPVRPGDAATPGAAASPLSPHPGAFRVADRFLEIAYTWKGAAFAKGKFASLQRRERAQAQTSTRLDAALHGVAISPETDVDTTVDTTGPGHVTRQRALSGGVIAYTISLPVTQKIVGGTGSASGYHVVARVNVKVRSGRWEAVGTSLPGATGPARYCVDSPAATQHCDIYPPGSA